MKRILSLLANTKNNKYDRAKTMTGNSVVTQLTDKQITDKNRASKNLNNNGRKILSVFTVTLFSLMLFGHTVNAVVIDDFSDGNYNGWSIVDEEIGRASCRERV